MINETDYRTLYPIVKSFVIQYECGGCPERLDDDIFHETCLRVLRLMRGKPEFIGISFDSIKRYVCKSYRINCKREKMYFRNCKEFVCDDFQKFETGEFFDFGTTEVIEDVGQDLEKEFSPELRKLFAKHVYHNISVRELEEESGQKNLKYAFKKMKDFLKKDVRMQELYGMKTYNK